LIVSCGRPHEVACSEILAQVYSYLDGELGEPDCAQIRKHLEQEECGPCLREFGLEEAVKRLVAEHCGCDPVPVGLREKVLLRIRQVSLDL
jgi:mycothiol system anti-sigma-R factor